ncbi:MAG TPA: RDD family protein [Reyranellaceae bacterium]|nr:RDD family protein [Reyranellaceae bacterium]
MSNVPNTGPAAPPPPVWDATPQGPAGTSGYGGFWIRVVAYIIDAIVINIATWAIGLVIGVNQFTVATDPTASYDPTATLVSLAIGWLYFALLESSERGATLGKMAVGLRVVTDQGQRLSFMHATGRYFAKFVSAIIIGIGFLMVAFTERKRGLHDMIAGTLVVKAR